MPYKSPWSLPIPEVSFATWLFTSPHTDLGDEPCYIDALRPDTHFLTRNGFRLWAQRLAVGLTHSAHFHEGDRILLFSPNTLFYPVAFMGIVLAGGVFSGANPTYTARELAYQLKDSGATYLLCTDTAIDVGLEAAQEAGLAQDRVFVFNSSIYDGRSAEGTQGAAGCRYWGELFAAEDEASRFQWQDLKRPHECDKIIALNYSSGTTGFPKGVEITHKNYVANTLQMQYLHRLRKDYKETLRRAKWLLYLPLYHAMAQTIFIAGAFSRKTPVYIMAKFDFIQMLECVQKFRITELSLVPPIAVALGKHPAVKKYDLSSVEVLGCGAAPLGSESSQQLEKAFNNRINLKQGYGMTEVTCSVLGWDPNEQSDSFSVGIPNANCECKVMKIDESADGKQSFHEVTDRGPEHRGELWVRGPNIMKGYWKKPEATQDAFSPDGERWLRTGDIAYVDEKGRFYIVDRMKELIKVKGNQVAPAELEALLLEHPAVADAAVIGVSTSDGDEAPRAFVLCQPEAIGKVKETEIQDFIADKVVRYKRLTGGVEFVDTIPKNPSGKILRKLLREQWKEQQAQSNARL